jgi:hypothetical protein
MWLIQKVEKKIGHWTYRWLSLGGRLVLEKYVLQNLHVYWLSLSKVPSSIINKIQQLILRFIWKGENKSTGLHLARWGKISRPKALGGWGIQNLLWFAQALSTKYC